MELWQLIVSICAGIITLLTALEKLGVTGSLKKIERDFTELKKLNVQMADMNNKQEEFGELQRDQNKALLAILRSELYKSFRINRQYKIWTDDECSVQTKLHDAYKALHGNGEEEIWWNHKKTWAIVTEAEYQKLVNCTDN